MITAPFVDGWEGRVIEGRFPLLEKLESNENCVSYFTVLQGLHEAVIQLISSNVPEVDEAIAQWDFAMSLSHPYLEKILAKGRCVIDGKSLVYVVSERSTTNLAKTIEIGSLTAEQTAEIFGPIVDALLYLHGNGVVHGHLNPSSIHFAGSQPRLAMTDLVVAGGAKRKISAPGNYDSPELWQGEASPAADVWSLGITLWEAMAGAPPSWDLWRGEEPEVPESLPSPFREIVRESLRLDPARRCTVEAIQGRLTANQTPLWGGSIPARVEGADLPSPVVAHAVPAIASMGASDVATMDRPAATAQENVYVRQPAARFVELAETDTELPAARFAAPAEKAERPPARFAEGEASPEPAIFSGTLSHFGETDQSRAKVVPLAFVLLLVIAAGSFWYVRAYGTGPIATAVKNAIGAVTGGATSAQKNVTSPSAPAPAPTDTPQTEAAQTQPQQTQPAQTQPTQSQPAQGATGPAASPGVSTTQPAESSTAKSRDEAQSRDFPIAQPAGARPARDDGAGSESASTSPVANRPIAKEPSTTARTADRPQTDENAKGRVERRVMPTVSPGARSEMRRPVEVFIRVTVNRRGSVSDASYVAPGPGNYFARQAQKAAESWKFKPPVTNGDAEASVWMLKFNFGRSGTDATATEQRR